MSALQLIRPKGSNYTGQCFMEGCKRNGKQRLLICGRPVLNPATLSLSKFDWLCDPCAKKFRTEWEELSGDKELRQVEAAIGSLTKPYPKRTEAVFALRELGFSSDEVVRALRLAGERVPVEQILEGLCGDGAECGAVAA